METNRRARHARASLRLLLWLLPLAGCGTGGPAARPADPGRARDVLVAALDAWKQGESPDAPKHQSAPIRVADEEWRAGVRLLDYRLEAGRAVVGEQSFPVALMLKARGRKATRRVEYRVVTDPVLAVSRQD